MVAYEYTLSTGETFYCQPKRVMVINQILESIGFEENTNYNPPLMISEGKGLYFQELNVHPTTKKHIIIPDYEFYPKEYEEKWRAFFKG